MEHTGVHPILAVDWGERRIGLAATDELGVTAHGLPTLVRKNRATDLGALDAVIAQRAIRTLLVGRPLHMDGAAGRSTHLAEQFGRTLAKRSGLPLILRDERLTSLEAADRAGHRGDIDQASAIVMLEEYMAETEAAR
ncbi:MAG: Holliday junction resolvase RuvX [Acidobacteria bacterium]|nr:Holliday junction resolvase RuvX [Acidobacteriota bacterium]